MYPELAQILTNLDQALSLNKQLRVLGVCYGHQAVAYHYKVAVEQKPQTGGIERVVMSPHLKNRFDFLPEVLWEEPLIISEHHQDYVMGVPQGFLLLAGSKSCEVEGLVREDGRILTVQFHSEFFVDYTCLAEERAKLCFK
jgi:GMP synthase (glutamine-hydrolysing)